MKQRHVSLMLMMLALAACTQSFTPRAKEATYDPVTKKLSMPHPCPDWSQPQENYKNENHSNFGCAVNNNLAAQIDNPADLHRGHGKKSPDTEVTTSVIQQYREGKIPVPLEPTESMSGNSQ